MWNQDPSTQYVCSAYQAWIRFRIWLNNQILKDWTWACDRDFCKSRISHSTQIKWIIVVQDTSNIFQCKYVGQRKNVYFLFLKHVEYVSKLLFTPRAKGFKGFLLLKWLSPNPVKRLIDWKWKSTSLGHAKHMCCGVVTCFPLFSSWSCCFYLNIRGYNIVLMSNIQHFAKKSSAQSSSHHYCSYVGISNRATLSSRKPHRANDTCQRWEVFHLNQNRGPSDSEEHFDQEDGATTDGCFLETETKLNPRGIYI